jgi:hypothetical protein
MGFTEKVGALQGINQPDGISVNGNRLFVTEGARFVEYSLQDLSVLAENGKKGEGPGELTVVPSIPNSVVLVNGTLLVEGINKVIRFSRNWELVKEVKKMGRMFRVLPAGEGYVAMQMEPGDKALVFVVSLFDSDMNRIRELHRQVSRDRRRELIMMRDTLNFSVFGDKIYIEDSVGRLSIRVFDFKGVHLDTIEQDIPLVKVNEADRRFELEQLKRDRMIQVIARQNGGWENFVKISTITYPDYFPPIQDMLLTEDGIFLKTFHVKDDKIKYLVLDLKGQFIRNVYLSSPVPPPFAAASIGRGIRMFAISDNIHYFLRENLETEIWELHREKI